jgi:hypothetical protein
VGQKQSDNKIKAVLDARDIPISCFGSGKGRQTRKFVLILIATWADPDGTNSYPSIKTIAEKCGLTERGVRKVVLWLETDGFLDVEYKSGPYGTNKYTVHVTEEARANARAKYAAKPKTPLKAGGLTGRYTMDTRNQSVPGAADETRNQLVPGVRGTSEQSTRNDSASDPERQHAYPEPIGSPYRPLTVLGPSVKHRPSNRPDGWLAGTLASLLQKKTGKVCRPTQTEERSLEDVADQTTDLLALLAFLHFLDRTKGVDDLIHPFKVFLAEFDCCVQAARSGVKEREQEHEDSGLLDEIQTILEEYGYPSGDALLFCELAFLQKWVLEESGEYSFALVRDYLGNRQTAAVAFGS